MIDNKLPLSRDAQCVLRGVQGFTPLVGQLVHMLEYVRQNTIDAVRNLTVQEVDTLVFPNGNTIGMLLAHIAGIETGYQGLTFRGERPDGNRPEYHLGGSGLQTFKNLSVEHYLSRLEEVRRSTLHDLSERDDDWLKLTYQPWGNRNWNNHFCWFHVMEDELRHQGQIVILKKEIRRREVEA